MFFEDQTAISTAQINKSGYEPALSVKTILSKDLTGRSGHKLQRVEQPRLVAMDVELNEAFNRL